VLAKAHQQPATVINDRSELNRFYPADGIAYDKSLTNGPNRLTGAADVGPVARGLTKHVNPGAVGNDIGVPIRRPHTSAQIHKHTETADAEDCQPRD